MNDVLHNSLFFQNAKEKIAGRETAKVNETVYLGIIKIFRK